MSNAYLQPSFLANSISPSLSLKNSTGYHLLENSNLLTLILRICPAPFIPASGSSLRNLTLLNSGSAFAPLAQDSKSKLPWGRDHPILLDNGVEFANQIPAEVLCNFFYICKVVSL